MTPRTKIRSLVFTIVFLFITNIVLILFLLFGKSEEVKPPTPELNMVGTFLKDSIGFDEKQMELYQNLRKADFRKGKPAFESLKSAKDKFYLNIYNDTIPDSVVNKLAVIIGETQIAVDKHMLQHFKNIRRICTAEQLPKFDSSFKNVVKKVTSERSRKTEHKIHR